MRLLLSLRYVAAGGALGALTRWGVVELVGDDRIIVALVSVNVIGSLLLGVLIGLNPSRRRDRRITENQFLLAGTGFCGALTTFSSYAVEVAAALEDGRLVRAAVVGVVTPLLAVLLAGIGYRLGALR